MVSLIPDFSSGYTSHSSGSRYGVYKDGFSITTNKGSYSRVNLATICDSDIGSVWYGEPQVSYVAISFPKPYNLYGFEISCQYHKYRVKGFNLDVQYDGGDGTWNTIYTNNSVPDAYFTMSDTFESCIENVIAIRILRTAAHTSMSAARWAISDFKLFSADVLCFLKSDNKYYSLKKEYYNTSLMTYTPLSGTLDMYTQGFGMDEICKEVTIENETFVPADKFDTFSVIKSYDANMKVLGCKSKSELIIPNKHIDISMAQTINYFKLLANQGSTGRVKLVFSVDNGLTWNSYNTTSKKLIPLDITIPLKPYDMLSDEQKTQWEETKTKIYTNGISYEKLELVDFNSIIGDSDRVRFAYIISKNDYDDVAELDELDFGFDAKGIMRKMKNSEFEVYSCVDEIIVTPNVDTDILQTHILI